MSDQAWWDVLGIDRGTAASWHRQAMAFRLRMLRRSFEHAISRLKEIEACTVVPLLNAYKQGVEELCGGSRG